MATVIQCWGVNSDKLVELRELNPTEQGFMEKSLERWLETTPEAIRDNLMIIGRQVATTSGPLDLLGLTEDGAIVVIELKRDRAPRETVAQGIDYASWIAEQTAEEIQAIASTYLKKPLCEAFRANFGEELPEIDPTNVSVVIVASRLDEATERMIQFLSRQYEMDINGLLVRYLKLPSGEQVLVKTTVVSEELVTKRADRGRTSAEALLRMADARGAGSLVAVLRRCADFLTEAPARSYGGSFRYWGAGRMLVGVNAASYWRAPNGTIDVWVAHGHLAQNFGLNAAEVVNQLGTFEEVKRYDGTHQIVLRTRSDADAIRLVELVRGWVAPKNAAAASSEHVPPGAS